MSEGRLVFLKKMGRKSATRHSSLVVRHSLSAFTLVEMLIVVAILAVLMTITFRLLKTGEDDTKRTQTLVMLQKIENCMSGYYAAFGSYPPVKLHGSRDFRIKVEDGEQTGERDAGGDLDDDQVQAACRAQPFGAEYPPSEAERVAIEKWGKEMSEHVSGGYDNFQASGYFAQYSFAFNGDITAPNPNEGFNAAFRSENPMSSWTQGVCLFKFGVMSFLVPRYLFMMRSNEGWFGEDGGTVCAQWADNNDMPHDPLEGYSYSKTTAHGESGWGAVKELAGGNTETETRSASQRRQDLARVENIPSQAVCARWMPNLEGLCATTIKEEFFGINITKGTWLRTCNGWTMAGNTKMGIFPPKPLPVHRPVGGGEGYCNGWITIQDGWGKEFFYYSPAPYQSYMVWSAGPNHKTFPPWVSLSELSTSVREQAMEWKSDDLMSMGEGLPNAKESNVMDMK